MPAPPDGATLQCERRQTARGQCWKPELTARVSSCAVRHLPSTLRYSPVSRSSPQRPVLLLGGCCPSRRLSSPLSRLPCSLLSRHRWFTVRARCARRHGQPPDRAQHPEPRAWMAPGGEVAPIPQSAPRSVTQQVAQAAVRTGPRSPGWFMLAPSPWSCSAGSDVKFRQSRGFGCSGGWFGERDFAVNPVK